MLPSAECMCVRSTLLNVEGGNPCKNNRCRGLWVRCASLVRDGARMVRFGRRVLHVIAADTRV